MCVLINVYSHKYFCPEKGRVALIRDGAFIRHNTVFILTFKKFNLYIQLCFSAYIQEIGRAGRDGSPAVATLFYNMTDISNSAKGMTDEMKNFCKLDTCRRDYLCQHFGFPSGSSVFVNKHECCDNCEKDCLCELCTEKQMLLCDNKQVDNAKPKKLQPSMKEHLELTLLEYFSAENEIIAAPNADLITGLSVTFAKEISSNHIFYTEKDNIINKHTILSPEIAENIALIVSALCLK